MVTHTKDLVELGNRIRARRRVLGFSQEKFANHTGIDRSYMGAIERGERNVTFYMLCDLAVGLGCDLGSLLKGLPDVPRKGARAKAKRARKTGS